jgi:hypothetical protein
MKKYLMTGVAALAMFAGFTACSSDEDFAFSEEEYVNAQTALIEAQYQQAFVNAFGQPAKNHTWGFGEYMTTRSGNTGDTYPQTEAYHNMNHNEWADPDKEFGGYKVPDPLTEEQKAVVAAYFQSVPNLTYEDPHLRHFFVQQVYKGGKVDAGQVRNTTEGITAANGTKYDSGNMNLLSVGQNNIHINDFNAGSCSTSNVLDNGQHVGGSSHTDQITLMVNIDDTSCFGYHETGSSTQHNNKAALVSWQTIRDWANANGLNGNCLADNWNRSFLGFDLAIKEGAQAQSDVAAKYNDGPDGSYSYAKINNEIVSVDGNTSMNIYYLDTNTNMYVAAEKKNIGDGDFIAEYRVNGDYKGKYINVDYLNTLIADGWLPVKDKNLREWVKVGKSDGYFSDWIVTLTEAKRIPGPEVKKVRVICEDLNATLGGYKGDFDFNDAVFDLYLDENDKVTEIELIWTGAEYDILVDGKEIHECLGIEKGKFSTSLGSYKFAPSESGKSPAEISVVAKRYWEVTDENGQKKQVTADLTLDVKQGKAPGKILVKPYFQIVPERTAIDEYYPKFKEYVKDLTVEWYEDPYEGE